MKFREFLNESNESNETTTLDMSNCKEFHSAVYFQKTKNYEIFYQNGDYVKVKPKEIKILDDIFSGKIGEELTFDEYEDEYGTPDFDTDYVIADVSEKDLKKLCQEVDNFAKKHKDRVI